MKITNYDVELSGSSKFQRAEKSSLNIEIFEAKPAENNQFALEDMLDISEEGLELLEVKSEDEEFFQLSEEDKAKIELLEKLITFFTGKEFKFHQSQKLRGKGHKNGQPKRAIGIRISQSNEIHEKEKMQFSSKGVVKTSDGREIDFSLNLKMSREYYEKNESVIQIGGAMKDPLVINLDNKGIGFGDKTIRIDLDLDGKVDEFKMLNSGSGFLALDKNENGKVDDGGELFGPETDNGFGELREYDEDGNNWIDESDEIFNGLKIWTLDEEGNEELIGLKEAGVGAIYLGNVSSEFNFKDGDEAVARITDTGIYLRENGLPGAIHEIDLKI